MKSKLLLLFVLAAIVLAVSSSASAQALRVNVMPGSTPGYIYPYTWPGRDLVVWGNVHDGTGPYTYTWDFGDGSPVETGTVSNTKYIAVNHTYSTMGPKVATLTVTDALMDTQADQVTIHVAPRDLEVETNAAIESGLRYLYLQQRGNGRWTDYGCDASTTAMAVLAFELRGHLPISDPDEDIYAEYVKLGLDYLTSILRTQSVPVQSYGDPEEVVDGNTDANGIGVYPASCYTGYETGMVLMAFVASGPDTSSAPDQLAPNGVAGIVGRTYRALAVDMVDYLAWAQNEAGGGYYRGGWRYNANYSSSDNSVSQWPPIGLEAAESSWGISTPGFVKTELMRWIGRTQYLNAGNWYDGAFYYQTGWARDAWPSTGAGLCEMAFCGVPYTDDRIQRALGYLDRSWNSYYNRGFYYSMYGVAKGCRIAVDALGDPAAINYIGAHEWQVEYNQWLVEHQNPNGSWPTTGWGAFLDDSWAVLVLTPYVRPFDPIAVIHGPVSIPPDFEFTVDGSASYHTDTSRTITEWLWDFDASDGVDWMAPDTFGATINNVSYSLPFGVECDTFTITLRVADDGGLDQKTATAEHRIIVVDSGNHAPIADAGGPYAGEVGEVICVDGSGSHDPDEDDGDYIAIYAWDLDGDGEFDDCFDPVCCLSWDHVYSGSVGLVVTDSHGATSDTSQAYVNIWTSEKDVGVYKGSVVFSRDTVTAGDLVTISATIFCDPMSDDVDNVTVRFYEFDPDVWVSQIGTDQLIPFMSGGDEVTLSVDFTVGYYETRTIYVRVDPQDAIEEFDEDNNEAQGTLRPTPVRFPLEVDIMPGVCPNPLEVLLYWEVTDEEESEARSAKLQMTNEIDVAILGSPTFNVRNIYPTSVQLGNWRVLDWTVADVSTRTGTTEGCDCNAAGPDGHDDLVLTLFKPFFMQVPFGTSYNSEYELTVTGMLHDFSLFRGSDCVHLLRPVQTPNPSGEVTLLGNEPNPFNPVTRIGFSLPTAADVRLDVYNILGQKVITLADGSFPAGVHEVTWDAEEKASGVYFYRLQVGDFVASKKMILLK